MVEPTTEGAAASDKREEAVDAFNDLKLSASPADKAAKLKLLTELLIHVQADLLPEFVPEICALRLTETNVQVRREVASFLEKVSALPYAVLVSSAKAYLPECFATLGALSRDKSEKVSKRAVMAGTALFTSVFRASVERQDLGALAASWQALADLKQSAGAILASREAKAGHRVYSAKYLECLVIFLNEDELKTLCLAGAGTDEGQHGRSADFLFAKFQQAASEAAHAIFELARSLAAALAAQAQAQEASASPALPPGPVAIVLLNALGAFAKARPGLFAQPVCEILAEVAATLGPGGLAGGHGSKVAALVQSLKQILLGLAKADGLEPFGVGEVCASALRAMGFNDAATQASRLATKRTAGSLDPRSEDYDPTKRPRLEAPPPSLAMGVAERPPDALDANALLAHFSGVAGQITEILHRELEMHDFEGPVLSPEATADAVLTNFGLDLGDFMLPLGGSGEYGQQRLGLEVQHRGDPRQLESSSYARSSAEALMDANLAAIHHVNTLSREDMKLLSLESLKRIFAANLESLAQTLEADEASIQDQLLSRIVTILLGNFWDRDRAYCERVLDALVGHILDQMQRDRGHATSMGLFYALFALGETFRAVYNALLLRLVKGMREKLPPHDTALCKLLLEVPILPQKEVVFFLKDMIVTSAMDREGDEEALEWATLGLNTLRDLVFERPSLRRACMNLSLACAMHTNQGLRAKAIKLVANTLYPVAYLQGDIEQFALKALRQLTTAREGSSKSLSTAEVSRHMELFFALCTKKHDLLHELLSMFARASQTQKQVMNQNVSSLAKRIPPTSPSVVGVVEAPPPGSEILLLLMLHSMAEEASALPKQLVRAIQRLYRKTGDARFLVPVFADLPKAEAVEILPKFVELPETARRTAIANAYKEGPEGRSAGNSLSASELFVRLHLIDEAKTGIPLKKLIECTTLCFKMSDIFTPKVLSMAIQQLVQYTPLPKLFMRTVIQTSKAAPQLKGFIVGLLGRLVEKRIWEDVRQWQGFLMCAKSMAPQSYPVLLQLPTPHLQAALQRMPDLKQPLTQFIQRDRSTAAQLPRTTLQALGLL